MQYGNVVVGIKAKFRRDLLLELDIYCHLDLVDLEKKEICYTVPTFDLMKKIMAYKKQISKVFSIDGELSQHIKGFRPREEQREMATAVEKSH